MTTDKKEVAVIVTETANEIFAEAKKVDNVRSTKLGARENANNVAGETTTKRVGLTHSEKALLVVLDETAKRSFLSLLNGTTTTKEVRNSLLNALQDGKRTLEKAGKATSAKALALTAKHFFRVGVWPTLDEVRRERTNVLESIKQERLLAEIAAKREVIETAAKETGLTPEQIEAVMKALKKA